MDRATDAADETSVPLPELTDELIDAAMERARRAVCGPLEERCSAFTADGGSRQELLGLRANGLFDLPFEGQGGKG